MIGVNSENMNNYKIFFKNENSDGFRTVEIKAHIVSEGESQVNFLNEKAEIVASFNLKLIFGYARVEVIA